jgi:hypothetical protein
MKQSNFTRKLSMVLAPLALGFGAALPAHAAIDITTATTGITDASVALLALLGALMALSATIFGVAKVYAFLKKKSGA